MGDAGGRDWRYLERLGKELYIVDISPQENFPNLIVQSIEEKTPFPNEFFDGVVMNEVLEHLFRDAAALEEVYRILKPEGILVVTVPYFSNEQDAPEFHVRAHTPKTIRRLLENCGFEIEEHFCRGFCCKLPAYLVYPFHKLAEWFLRGTPDESVSLVNEQLNKIERFLGTHPLTSQFQKLFTSYGGILKAKKGKKKDYHAVQRAHFSKSDLG